MKLRHILGCTALSLSFAAQGQFMPTGVTMMNNVLNQQMMDLANKPYVAKGQFGKSRLQSASAGKLIAKSDTTIAAYGNDSNQATIPAKLAASYPQPARAEAQRTFTQLLAQYRNKIEPTFAIPKNDIAGSVAAFLAGSYMAFHNVDFPDENFKPLVNQMRIIIGGNAEFAQATDAEKQELYEQMAILGMFLAGTQMELKNQPNHPQAAQIKTNMRQAAKGYLEQFLKTDADRVQITANGLVLR
jgi:hypothetical protein